MELTKRQEKQLLKSFDNPKKLRKWIDEIYHDMISSCEKQTKAAIEQYLDIYNIAVAYTLRYVGGFGKKRLPEVMNRIWNNVDSFRTGHLSFEDCLQELKENGIEYDAIVNDNTKIKWSERISQEERKNKNEVK